MENPKIEQLINNGKIGGIDFDNPMDFSEDSWGKYNSDSDNWGTRNPATGKMPYVATFGLVRKWILKKFENITNSITNLTNSVENIDGSVQELNNNMNSTIELINQNVENSISQFNNNINNFKYKIKIRKTSNGASSADDEEYELMHNVFRITRPENTTSWGILDNPHQNMELRLGPFDELLEESDITKSGDYINLTDVVDYGEEIIIKILPSN